MTVFISHDQRCGHCGRTSSHPVMTGSTHSGIPDLDFRPAELARSSMFAWLQQCPHCGYCAPDISAAPADPAVLDSAQYRKALSREDFPEVARRFLAHAVASSPSRPLQAAQAFLHAAWICDDHQLVRQAAICRQLSASWFLRCKPFASNVEGLSTATVLVDVLRRCGRFAEAARECRALLSQPALPPALRAILSFALGLIGRRDARCHSAAECLPRS
jgi:hypothetical protein